MPGVESADELRSLRKLVEALRNRITAVEAQAMDAEQEAHQAREEILQLRDQVAAAQRDQQDLKATRAQLARVRVRGLVARIVNRS